MSNPYFNSNSSNNLSAMDQKDRDKMSHDEIAENLKKLAKSS